MPLVFVHGVATRQTPEHQAQVQQRDALFKKLVLPQGAAEPFDPDWGSKAVKFDPRLPWIPQPKKAEAWAIGGGVGSESGIARIANKKPELAVDLAFQAGLAARVSAATQSGKPAEALPDEDIAAFEAAVNYLEQGADKDVFDPDRSDVEFLSDLGGELAEHTPPKTTPAEPMSLASGALDWLGRGLKNLVDPVANVSSDAVLRLVRRPLSGQIALFLGDIFVYLRWRETDNAKGTGNRIFEPIVNDLVEASKSRSPTDPVIVVGHSLGGVILYDLLSDQATLANIKQKLGSKFIVDTLVTVGAQPALFADMSFFENVSKSTDDKFPCPPPVRSWLNVYDYTDVLSFSCEGLFNNVTDYEFDNVTGLFSAHSAYFQRPSFYSRLRNRLKQKLPDE